MEPYNWMVIIFSEIERLKVWVVGSFVSIFHMNVITGSRRDKQLKQTNLGPIEYRKG